MSQHARDESPSSSSSSEVQPPKKKARTTSPLSSAGQRNLSNSSNFANVLNSSDLFEDASGSEPSVGRDEIRSSGILFTSQTMRLSQNEDLSDRQFSALDLHSSARLQNATPTNPSSDSYFSSFLNTSMNTSMNAPASGQSNQFYNPSISGGFNPFSGSLRLSMGGPDDLFSSGNLGQMDFGRSDRSIQVSSNPEIESGINSGYPPYQMSPQSLHAASGPPAGGGTTAPGQFYSPSSYALPGSTSPSSSSSTAPSSSSTTSTSSSSSTGTLPANPAAFGGPATGASKPVYTGAPGGFGQQQFLSPSQHSFARDVISLQRFSPPPAFPGTSTADPHDKDEGCERLVPSESPHPYFFPKYKFTVGMEVEEKVQEVQNKFSETIRRKMEDLRHRLKMLRINPLDERETRELETLQSTLSREMESSKNRLETFLSTSLLPPRVLHRLVLLKRDILIEEQQLALYITELQHCVRPNPHSRPTYATLVVAKQPFPKPIKKNIKVCGADGSHEEPTLVRLLRFSRAEIRPTSEVKADVIIEDYHEKEGSFTSDTVQMDAQGFASFYSLKFLKATRKKVARLQFSLEASVITERGDNIIMPIQGGQSAPFIVFTNESQWEESEGILLKKDCFSTNDVTFERFANYLQMHFLRSTRQDPYNPERGLSIHDLNYISRAHLNGKNHISKSDFDEFLKWFGKVLRKIRHQQNFHVLWVKGYVYGFISRTEAENLLSTTESGTFLIRFSESAPGKVVITSIHDNLNGRGRKYEHLLVSPGQPESHTRLLEILRKGEKLRYSVVMDPTFSPDRERLFQVQRKEEVFGEYFSKPSEEKISQHYVMDNDK